MATREELMQTRPPQDVIDDLNAFSENTKKPMDEIKKRFYEILAAPYLDQFDIEDRCRNASKILLAQIADEKSGNYQTATFEFKVIDKTAIKETEKEVEEEDPQTGNMVKVTKKNHMSKIFGIFAGHGEDNADQGTKFGILTLWGDANQSLSQFQKDQCYIAELGFSESETKYELSSNDPVTLKPTTIEVPPIKDMIKNFFPVVPVSMFEENLSAENTRGDYRLLLGRVRSGRIALNKKGNNMGWLDIIDDAMPVSEVNNQDKYKQSIMFLDAPEMATRYITGSLVMVLAETSKTEEYGKSAFGQLVVPIVGIPGNIPREPAGNTQTPPAENNVPPQPPTQQSSVPNEGNQTQENATQESSGTAPTQEADVPADPTAPPTPSDTTGW